jgi:hypothetical protein
MMRSPSSPARSYQPLDFGEDSEEERKAYGIVGRLSLIASRMWRGTRPLLSRYMHWICSEAQSCCVSSFPCHFWLQVLVFFLCQRRLLHEPRCSACRVAGWPYIHASRSWTCAYSRVAELGGQQLYPLVAQLQPPNTAPPPLLVHSLLQRSPRT